MIFTVRKVSIAAVLLLFCISSIGKGVDTSKEKVVIKVNIPPFLELAPKESTYKFKFPRELTYYDEKKFGSYAKGFNDIDGRVFGNSKTLFSKKILGDSPTDYTFELVTKGIVGLQRVGKVYRSSSFGNGYVQDFSFRFPCVLKIYKKDQMVKEFLLDDGSVEYSTTFFKDFTNVPANDKIPYSGYSDTTSISKSLNYKSQEFYKFGYIVEYMQYHKHMLKAYDIIQNMLANYDLKTYIPVEFVDDKKTGDTYSELNTQCRELFNDLSQITTFDDIINKAETYKKLAEYFEAYSNKDGLDKKVKILCLRNLATSQVMIGQCEKAFVTIKQYDKLNSSFFSSLRSTLFDLFNVFSSRNYYSVYKSDDLVQNTSLNECYDREDRAIEAEQKAKEAEVAAKKAMANAEMNKEEQVKSKERNIPFLPADIVYTDDTKGYAKCAITFYIKDQYGNIWDKCGRFYRAINEKGDTVSCDIKGIKSISFTQLDKTKMYFDPVTIVAPESIIGAGYLFNKQKLLYRFSTYKNYVIYTDLTNPSNTHFVLVPLQNNPKNKGYVLQDIAGSIEYPLWMKQYEPIRSAVTNHKITNDIKGALYLLDLLEQEKIAPLTL